MKIKNFFLILLCLSLGLSAGAKNKTKALDKLEKTVDELGNKLGVDKK
jgi:hypothetical protein